MNIINGKMNLTTNLCKQLSLYWNVDTKIVVDSMDKAIERLEECLSCLSKNKYIWKDELVFNPVNSVQYSVFLYYLSNEIYRNCGACIQADAVYYLNKIINSVEWFYEVELPGAFYAEHPLSSVLGKAHYGERLFVYQGTTIGGNYDETGLHYPCIGNNVLMYANASIIGKSTIGSNVVLSTGCCVVNQDVPDNCIVFGKSPDLVIKGNEASKIHNIQSRIWKM